VAFHNFLIVRDPTLISGMTKLCKPYYTSHFCKSSRLNPFSKMVLEHIFS